MFDIVAQPARITIRRSAFYAADLVSLRRRQKHKVVLGWSCVDRDVLVTAGRGIRQARAAFCHVRVDITCWSADVEAVQGIP